jgi:hypothetical protein
MIGRMECDPGRPCKGDATETYEFIKEESMALEVRRIVTGHNSQGQAVVASDERLAGTSAAGRAGISRVEVWSTGKMPIDNSDGTVNLTGRVSRMRATGSGHWGLLPTHPTDFGPDLEFLGPGSSMLCGSDVIAAEVEEVIDLIVG